MSSALAQSNGNGTKITKVEQALIDGDLSQLSGGDRWSYYNRLCESLGLNPLSQPFSYLRLNGKLVLYPNATATFQMGKSLKISFPDRPITEKQGDLYSCEIKAVAHGNGGDRVNWVKVYVSVGGLSGEKLANAYMKAETKAKRRAIIQLSGFAFADESDAGVEQDFSMVHPAIAEPKHLEDIPVSEVLPEAMGYVQRIEVLKAIASTDQLKSWHSAYGLKKASKDMSPAEFSGLRDYCFVQWAMGIAGDRFTPDQLTQELNNLKTEQNLIETDGWQDDRLLRAWQAFVYNLPQQPISFVDEDSVEFENEGVF